jgi:hypothetical protein
MNYQELRKEAIKCAVNLTDAMLKRDEPNIELNSFKLNYFVSEMLDKLHVNDETTKQIKKTL